MDDKRENIYVKLPYINEELKRRALSVMRISGINNVKINFMNGRPSSRVFSLPRDRESCREDCETCKSAIKPKQCLTKNVIYEITCSHCGIVYVGEIGRTIGWTSRSIRHNLEILHRNITYQVERKCIEAFEIHNRSENIIMNGCIFGPISI
jgi:hypothetical protein